MFRAFFVLCYLLLDCYVSTIKETRDFQLINILTLIMSERSHTDCSSGLKGSSLHLCSEALHNVKWRDGWTGRRWRRVLRVQDERCSWKQQVWFTCSSRITPSSDFSNTQKTSPPWILPRSLLLSRSPPCLLSLLLLLPPPLLSPFIFCLSSLFHGVLSSSVWPSQRVSTPISSSSALLLQPRPSCWYGGEVDSLETHQGGPLTLYCHTYHIWYIWSFRILRLRLQKFVCFFSPRKSWQVT